MGCLNFNIEVVSRGIDVRSRDTSKHLDLSCSFVCAVELKWEQFLGQEGVFYDFDGEEFLVKKM